MRVLAVALVLFVQQVGVGQIQSWYEAGEYQEIAERVEQITNPMGTYLLGSSYERLDRFAEARMAYQQLSARDESDPWASIGRAAAALVADGEAPPPEAVEEAFTAAQQAVALVSGEPAVTGPVAAIAQYQLGLVHAFRGDNAGAAEAFEAAQENAPAFAYAYYYGGQAQSRLDRPDQMAISFERFLQLAPDAPEARRGQSLMRSVRGR